MPEDISVARTERDQQPDESMDEPMAEQGIGIPLRLLALLGAFSFLMIGISSLMPPIQTPEPPAMPDERSRSVS